MPTFNIGDDSGGYFNWRGTNVNPRTVGSSVSVGNWLVSSFSIQMAGGSSGGTVRGTIWNANGNAVWRSGSTSTNPADTSAPFGSKTFSPNIYLSPGTYYFGFSKSDSSSLYWDCVNGNNTSRCGNTENGDLTYGGTGTIFRRLCGKISYTDVSVPTMSSCTATANIGSISVSWAASSDGGMGITSYAVYRNNDGNQLVYNGSGTSFTDNVGNGVGAYYVVYAFNAVGTSNAAVSGTATTPSVPTMSSCTATATAGSISVSWAASSDGGNAIDYYHVYRNGGYLGQYTGTSLTDNVGNGFTAYYQAYAHNGVGWSGAATSSTVTTPVEATAPATLVAVPDVTQVVLTWTAPASTGGSPITSYKLEFSTDNTNWTQIYNALSPLTYTHTERIPATLYYYRVSAISAPGQSPFNNAQAETIGGYVRYFDSLGFVDYVLPEYYSSSASAWKKASAFSYEDGIWVPGDYPPAT